METRKRYCPSCGDKTNDSSCCVCGRATKSINDRYTEKELSLVEDDLKKYASTSDFTGDEGNKESNAYHKSNKPILKYGNDSHPYYETDGRKQKVSSSTRLEDAIDFKKIFIVVIAVLVLVGCLIFLGMSSFAAKQIESSLIDVDGEVIKTGFKEEVASLDKYYVKANNRNASLTLDIQKEDGLRNLVIHNPTKYFVYAEIEENGTVDWLGSAMAPFETRVLKSFEEDAKVNVDAYKLTITDTFHYSYLEPLFPYTMDKSDYSDIKFYLSKMPNEEELINFMKYQITSCSLVYTMTPTQGKIYVQDQLAYTFEVDAESRSVKFKSENGSPAVNKIDSLLEV